MSFRVCRHIKTNGLQCHSPALRADDFCYFHTTLRRRHRSLASATDTSTLRPVYDRHGNFSGMEPLGSPSGGIQLGLLEDTAAVQVAISTVIHALANNRLEVRRATALLYGLQLAASNARALKKDGWSDPTEMLRDAVMGKDEEPIAHPGLNSDQAWMHPVAPDAFTHEDEDRPDDSDGCRQVEAGSDRRGDREDRDRRQHADDSKPAAEEDDEVGYCTTGGNGGDEEEPLDCKDDPEAGYDQELDEAECDLALIEFRTRVRESFTPEMRQLCEKADRSGRTSRVSGI